MSYSKQISYPTGYQDWSGSLAAAHSVLRFLLPLIFAALQLSELVFSFLFLSDNYDAPEVSALSTD